MPSGSDDDLGERLGLPDIVLGIAQDLKDLREARISIRDARARAELARELLRAVRLVIDARKFIEAQALPAPVHQEDDHGRSGETDEAGGARHKAARGASARRGDRGHPNAGAAQETPDLG
jgi:hypothetical protein